MIYILLALASLVGMYLSAKWALESMIDWSDAAAFWFFASISIILLVLAIYALTQIPW